MFSKPVSVIRPAKTLNCSVRATTRWMFPSGINYFSIARAERDANRLDDPMKWMIPSGVNYKPR